MNIANKALISFCMLLLIIILSACKQTEQSLENIIMENEQQDISIAVARIDEWHVVMLYQKEHMGDTQFSSDENEIQHLPQWCSFFPRGRKGYP